MVILAGGLGTRLAEETVLKPKPMVEIGGRPILWHIMKIFGAQGFNEFIVCLGYKGYVIKEYFANYFLHNSDITIDVRNNQTVLHHNFVEPWKITLVDTGLETLTGGRLKRIHEYINNEPFLMTYGDGVADVDLQALLRCHHKAVGPVATLTMVQPQGRFGAVVSGEESRITHFQEKPLGDGGWVNGGFFVLEASVFDYLEGDNVAFEQGPLQAISADGKLFGYKHFGFWQAMDTLRDVTLLNDLWNSRNAAWQIW